MNTVPEEEESLFSLYILREHRSYAVSLLVLPVYFVLYLSNIMRIEFIDIEIRAI